MTFTARVFEAISTKTSVTVRGHQILGLPSREPPNETRKYSMNWLSLNGVRMRVKNWQVEESSDKAIYEVMSIQNRHDSPLTSRVVTPSTRLSTEN
jgi:hypothetical protein